MVTVGAILARLRALREAKGVSATDLERSLILGPGWIDAFEAGSIVPTLDVLLAILDKLTISLNELTAGLDTTKIPTELSRKLHATQDGTDLIIHFDYTDYQAQYRLPQATPAAFDGLLLNFRDGLARSVTEINTKVQAIKTDSVADAFLQAVSLWPTANSSDLWWFVIYRAYCDPFNHPASESRRDFGQSWRRTGGWALEEVLVRHYGPWLATQGVRLFIAKANEKNDLIGQLSVADRLEADKVDVLLTTNVDQVERCFGVIHVKASFAERRTDDVPMSTALVEAGYTSPMWTMDCKSGPSATPVNRGELGAVLSATTDPRSAKRKDIEDDGYFSACFSYNQNTIPTPAEQTARARIIVCDFQNPNDAFGQFIIAESRRFAIQHS